MPSRCRRNIGTSNQFGNLRVKMKRRAAITHLSASGEDLTMLPTHKDVSLLEGILTLKANDTHTDAH